MSSVKIVITNFRNRRDWNYWILRMEKIGSSETSVRNNHYSLRNNPETCSSLSSRDCGFLSPVTNTQENNKCFPLRRHVYLLPYHWTCNMLISRRITLACSYAPASLFINVAQPEAKIAKLVPRFSQTCLLILILVSRDVTQRLLLSTLRGCVVSPSSRPISPITARPWRRRYSTPPWCR